MIFKKPEEFLANMKPGSIFWETNYERGVGPIDEIGGPYTVVELVDCTERLAKVGMTPDTGVIFKDEKGRLYGGRSGSDHGRYLQDLLREPCILATTREECEQYLIKEKERWANDPQLQKQLEEERDWDELEASFEEERDKQRERDLDKYYQDYYRGERRR